jgi:hypothetical protein
VKILEELGQQLVTERYADDFLAVSPKTGWMESRRVFPLNDEQLRILRLDAASHYLRLNEAYGDAFLEAISQLLGLGTYVSNDISILESGPFRGYQDLVVFDNSGARLGLSTRYEEAHEDFQYIRAGGEEAKGLFGKPHVSLDDMSDEHRELVYLGPDILMTDPRSHEDRK